MKILIKIFILIFLQYHSNAQYFSSAIRGNMPRLGKRMGTLNGLNLVRPDLFTNQEMSGQYIFKSPIIDNTKPLDDLWTSRMNKMRVDMNSGLTATRKNFNDYIQISLYNLLSSIIQYNKENIEE